MNGSYIFLLHLVGFGLFSAMLVSSIVLERKLRLEPDWGRKIYLINLLPSRFLGILALALLLLTGAGNIYNRYLSSPEPWHSETWLMAKMILFFVLILNGAITGRILLTRRLRLIKYMSENKAVPNAEESIKSYNKGIMIFYLIQIAILIAILYLAVFGGSKHPGII